MADTYELQGGVPVRTTEAQQEKLGESGVSHPISEEKANQLQGQINDLKAAQKANADSGTPDWLAGAATDYLQGSTFGFGVPGLLKLKEALGSSPEEMDRVRSIARGQAQQGSIIGKGLGLLGGGFLTGGLFAPLEAAGVRAGGMTAGLAARGAAEGALYGAGGEVEKSALENKPLAAEAVLAKMGEGAIFGGAIGGAMGAAGQAAKWGASKTNDVIASALQRNVGAEKASSVLMEKLGASSKTIGKLSEFEGGVAGAAKEGSEMLEPYGLKLSSNPAKVREVAAKTADQAETLITKTAREFDKAGTGSSPSLQRFVKDVEENVIATKGMMPGSVHQAERLSRWLDSIETGSATKTTFQNWVEARPALVEDLKRLGDDGKAILASYDKELQTAMRGAEALDDSLKGASGRFEGAQKAAQLGRGIEDLMTDRLSGSRSLVSGHDLSTAAAITMAGHPVSGLSYALGKAAYRGIADAVGPHLAESVWRASTGIKTAAAVSELKGSISKAVRGFLRSSGGAARRAGIQAITRDKYDNEINHTYSLLQRTREERLKDFMAASGSPVLAQAMVQKSDRAISNTQNDIPVSAPSKHLGQVDKLRAVPLPAFLNDKEHAFLRTHGAVKNPLSVINSMEQGRVSKDTVQALKQNWPETYNLIIQTFQKEVMEMRAKGKTLPMSKITQLSILLDKPLDTTLTPAFIQPIQEALQEAQPQNQAKPTQGPETSADTQEYQTPAEKVIQ